MLCLSMPPSVISIDQKVSVLHPSPSKRPKLSLQTSVCDRPRSFGKSCTDLSLPRESSSPTLRNTYSNAYHILPASATLARPPTPLLSSPSEARALPVAPCRKHGSPWLRSPCEQPLNTAALLEAPRHQPVGIRSILRNGLLPRHRVARARCSRPKRVSYASPIFEEIRTTRYTLAHSDLVEAEGLERDSESGNPAASTASPVERSHAYSLVDGARASKAERRGWRNKREWAWTIGTDRLGEDSEESFPPGQ